MREIQTRCSLPRAASVFLATVAIMVAMSAGSAFATTGATTADNDPIVNGCSFSPDYPTVYRFPFKRSCNGHDLCYGNFHFFKQKWRRHCDRGLYKSLRKVCRHVPKGRRLCRVTAYSYYRAVKRFGGHAYKEAQSKASAGAGDIGPNFA